MARQQIRFHTHSTYRASTPCIILLIACSLSLSPARAQSPKDTAAKKHTAPVPKHKPYDWSPLIKIDIDRKAWPGKYKVIEDILNNMAADPAGRQIFENIAANNRSIISIRDKEDMLKATYTTSMFSADYGIQVIRSDMKYNPIDNELVVNFGKSGEMLCFDEQRHQFFKESLNSTIARELEYAGLEQSETERNCRFLLAKLTPAEKFLFDNYKDLMGEKFTAGDIEHCRGKQISIHNFNSNTDDLCTFTDNVVDLLREYRDFVEMRKKYAYAIDTREMPLSDKYLARLGEPRRSREPVFTLRLGENKSHPLQFGPITGTDYIALGTGEHNVYKNFSVFYDTDEKQDVDNPTALTRIKEEFIAQLRYNTEALNSPKMLEYVDRLKKYFNPKYHPATDYKAIADEEVAKVMRNNPYLAGADRVIEAEAIWTATRQMHAKGK